MIKKLTSTATAIALTLSIGGTALAADLPSHKAPPVYLPPPPVFTWTGFYAGLNLGGGWRERNYYNDYSWALFGPAFFPGLPFGGFGFGGWGNNNNNGNGGVVGGGQIGYNYQFSPWLVVGLETDFQGTSIGSGGGGNGGWWWGGNGHGERIPWFGTVRGRLGITPFDAHLLIYGTGGFAYGEVRRDTWWFNNSATQTGWTAGGGIEWAPVSFPSWSVKIEYLYTDLSGNHDNGWNWGWGLNNTNRHTRFNTVRAGVNYHFNLFNPSPVVAKY